MLAPWKKSYDRPRQHIKKQRYYFANKGQFSSVQSLSHVWLFGTLWTAACQASQSITNSRSLLKFMPIESVMPPNHLILCHPLLLLASVFPSIRVFSNESIFQIRWSLIESSIAASASALVLPMNIQNWFLLELNGLISLQSKGLSRVFSNTTVQNLQFSAFFMVQLSHPYMTTGKP